jgi:hypothetical protein
MHTLTAALLSQVITQIHTLAAAILSQLISHSNIQVTELSITFCSGCSSCWLPQLSHHSRSCDGSRTVAFGSLCGKTVKHRGLVGLTGRRHLSHGRLKQPDWLPHLRPAGKRVQTQDLVPLKAGPASTSSSSSSSSTHAF